MRRGCYQPKGWCTGIRNLQPIWEVLEGVVTGVGKNRTKVLIWEDGLVRDEHSRLELQRLRGRRRELMTPSLGFERLKLSDNGRDGEGVDLYMSHVMQDKV